MDTGKVSAAESKGKRKRAPNFSRDEVFCMQEVISKGDNLKTINCKFSNTVTNKMKTQLWECIAREVSNLGFCLRSPQDCSNKWQNLKRESKEAYTEEKIYMRGTGGGPKTDGMTCSQAAVVDMLKDTASFSGIPGGLDSDEADGKNYLANLPEKSSTGDDQSSSSVGPTVTTKTVKPTVTSTVATATTTVRPTATTTVRPTATTTVRPTATYSSNSSTVMLKPSPMKRMQETINKATEDKRHYTTQDLLDAQVKYFKMEAEKGVLEKEKLKIQISILKKLDARTVIEEEKTVSFDELMTNMPYLQE